MKIILIFFLTIIFLTGCTNKEKRKLLFSCEGVMYTRMVDESFQPNTTGTTVPIKSSFFIGEHHTEVNGYRYDICENNNTRIVFGNCEKKDLVNFHTFDLVTHKLYDYGYFSESLRLKKNFPLTGDDIRGEYKCTQVENKVSK